MSRVFLINGSVTIGGGDFLRGVGGTAKILTR